MPAIITRPNYTRAMREARSLLEQFDIVEPPVDPVHIARHLNVQVYFVKFQPESQNISGFFDFEENAIFVNEDEFPLRQTFTVAHELGHKILHAEWARSGEYRVLLRDQENDKDEPHEKEANVFAANLLVPKCMLDRYYANLSVEQLSRLFAVSVPMIRNRLSREYGIV